MARHAYRRLVSRSLVPIRVLLIGVICALVIPRTAYGADVPIPGDKAVEIHGFVSPGFIATTGNNYLAKSKRGSFEFTEVGLNFTVPLTDNLRTGMQLFARDLGPTGNYSPKADWFYLDYRFGDYLGIRAGRVKIPFGLYNDSSDVDAARVPILLPQSIYSISNRDFLLAQTGGEIYGRVRSPSIGAFEYRLYGGTIYLATQTTVTDVAVTDIDVPYVVGERLIWETPLDGLRLGASLQALRIDLVLDLQNTPGVPPNTNLSLGVPVVLWVGSVEYALHDLLFAAEYSRWTARIDSNNHLLIPAIQTTSERGYAMTSYRLNPWFQPGVYYSLFYPDVDHRDGRQQTQHDVAGTLRFDINANWLVKLEGHFMSGTAALDSSLNDGKKLSEMEKNWGVFLVKTTAHF